LDPNDPRAKAWRERRAAGGAGSGSQGRPQRQPGE
jgi:hypothetical protein